MVTFERFTLLGPLPVKSVKLSEMILEICMMLRKVATSSPDRPRHLQENIVQCGFRVAHGDKTCLEREAPDGGRLFGSAEIRRGGLRQESPAQGTFLSPWATRNPHCTVFYWRCLGRWGLEVATLRSIVQILKIISDSFTLLTGRGPKNENLSNVTMEICMMLRNVPTPLFV